MKLLPPRRWFRFRLSTWFVLLGILCWFVSTPCNLYRHYSVNTPGEFVWLSDTTEPLDEFPENVFHLHTDIYPNPRLLGPTLALLAFITWKAFWAVRARRVSAVEVDSTSTVAT